MEVKPFIWHVTGSIPKRHRIGGGESVSRGLFVLCGTADDSQLPYHRLLRIILCRQYESGANVDICGLFPILYLNGGLFILLYVEYVKLQGNAKVSAAIQSAPGKIRSSYS
jgi:hypothetical protein